MKKILNRKYILIFPLFLVCLYFAVPPPVPLFSADYSTVVIDEKGEILRAFLNTDEQWCFPPRTDIPVPEKLEKAVLSFEDRYFYYHPGINPFALARAFYHNWVSGRIVSGASTITMQVARLMQPKKRTYCNKAREMLQALRIELHYSKEDILRLYLDHAPYGGNIIGCQAASLRYFQKMPKDLTWGEAAILAVLPNAPGEVSPFSNQEQLRRKRNRLLARLRDDGVIDKETCDLALLEAIPAAAVPFQMRAPHLAQFLKGAHSGIIKTTIKKELQEQTEDLVHQHVVYLRRKGVRNGAAVVTETRSGKVRAYVGSQDFFDTAGHGQVDGVRAPRSSGSLLKPVLYALCIDEGIILPQTLIKDVPSYYGAFSPCNADETFNGLVPAKEALVKSLNVPAVRLLYTYGPYPFYHVLKSAGLTTLFRASDDYGLTMVLGGAEVTLWDMAMLFRGFGNAGRFRPLHVLADGGDEKRGDASSPLISPAACYLTLDMLRELKRPGAEYYWEQYQNQWPLAWKTGTSYGQRDGWAVGVSPEWTIAVWVGNFDGEGNANLSGARCAGPLLFDIFNALPKNVEQSWFEKPQVDFVPAEVCLDTGFLAGPHCEKRIIVDVPRHMKPMKMCPYHQSIYVTEDEQHQVCSLCWEPGHYKHVRRLVYPPDVTQYLRERGQIISAIPPHKPYCVAHTETLPLQIVYPQEKSRLWVPRDFDGILQKVALQVAHREAGRMLYWYMDDRFIGSSKDRHVKASTLTKGWHTLEVVDAEGNRDQKQFYVDMRK